MRTAISGKVRLKWFWGCTYSGSGMTPIGRVFEIGRLVLAKVVYAQYTPFDRRYYRKDVLDSLEDVYNFRWEVTPCPTDSEKKRYWWAVYSKVDGGYVGTPEDAYRLFQRGVRLIQKADTAHNTCSIGYHPQKAKWYGWSHRAMYGFGVGDSVKEGDCCASSGWTEEYLAEHPDEDASLPVGYVAEDLNGAKKMAIAFAESVS